MSDLPALCQHFIYVSPTYAYAFGRSLLNTVPHPCEAYAQNQTEQGNNQWELSYGRVHMDYDLGDDPYYGDYFAPTPNGSFADTPDHPLHAPSVVVDLLQPSRSLLKVVVNNYVHKTAYQNSGHRERTLLWVHEYAKGYLATTKHVDWIKNNMKSKPQYRSSVIMATVMAELEDKPFLTDDDEAAIFERYESFLQNQKSKLIQKTLSLTSALEIHLALSLRELEEIDIAIEKLKS